MAIANSYALAIWPLLTAMLRLLLYTYKSNTVHKRTLLRAQQRSLPQTLDLGKRSPTTNAQKILVSVISRVFLLQEEWHKFPVSKFSNFHVALYTTGFSLYMRHELEPNFYPEHRIRPW